MKKGFLFSLFLFILFLPVFLYSNEPLVPFMILFVGPTTLGGLAFGSLIGFFLIIIIKILVFLWKSDFRSGWAVLFVIIANIVSTIIGVIVAGMFSSSLIFPFGAIVLYFVFLLPARRLARLEKFSKNSSWSIAFFFLIVVGITVVLFGLMSGFMAVPYIYWSLKIVMATLAMGISLIISVVYEEAVISDLYKILRKERKSFMEPVLWGNIIGLGVLMLGAAIMALPERFASPDFLIKKGTGPFFIGRVRRIWYG
jgi:hypothetical protein